MTAYLGGTKFADSGSMAVFQRPASGVLSDAVRMAGWAHTPLGEAYIETAPVPAGATKIGGVAFTSDGAVYVTTEAVDRLKDAYIGGAAVRQDGAIRIDGGAVTASDAFLGGAAYTQLGAARIGGGSFALAFANTGSIKPVAGGVAPTFTRATTATTVDHESMVRAALSGEARMQGLRRVQNLWTFSQDQSNAVWTKTAVTVTANAGTAPDGSSTATLIVPTTANSTHLIGRNTAVPTGNNVAISFYIRAAGYPKIYWGVSSVGASFCNFALAAPQTSQDAGPVFGFLSMGNGWFRCSQIATVIAGSVNFVFQFGDAAGAPGAFTGDGVSGVYLWGMQIEDVTGQSVQQIAEYVSNGVLSTPYHGANVDGVKYFPNQNGNTVSALVLTEAAGAIISATTRLGYLGEGARTNLILQSEVFDNASWIKGATATVTANAAIAPDGTLTADQINLPAVLDGISQSVTTVNASTYTGSFYLRAAGAATITLKSSVGGLGTVQVNLTASWQRFSFTFVAGGVSEGVQIQRAVAGDATTIFAWGADFELGPFASSYIPTTTVTVTRNLDTLTYPLTGWYNTLTGTLYAQYLTQGLPDAANAKCALSIDGGSANDTIKFDLSTANVPRYSVAVAAANQAVIGIGAAATNISVKMAAGYALNDFQAARDGVLGAADTVGTVPTVTLLSIGNIAGSASQMLFGTVAGVSYLPRRLTDAQFQSMST